MQGSNNSNSCRNDDDGGVAIASIALPICPLLRTFYVLTQQASEWVHVTGLQMMNVRQLEQCWPHSRPQMLGVVITVIDRDMKLVLGLRGLVKALP